MPAILVIRGTLHAAHNTMGNSVAGFRLSASVARMVPITDGDPTTIPILCTGGGIADAEGAFEFTLGGDGGPGDSIALVVATPDGTQVFAEEFTLQEVAQPLTLEVEGLPPLLIAPAEERGNRIPLLGRVLDEGGRGVPAGLPIVLWGAEEASDPPRPLVIAKTTSGGYFSGDWVSTRLHEAFGRIDGAGDTPIRLDDERLPRRVLLVMAVPQNEPKPGGPPRAPDPAALTDNPAAFSQDLGRGCVQLSVPNRAIEEFIYTQVVRTSEPEVKGLTLGLGRRKLPPDWIAPLVEAAVMAEAMRTGAVARRNPNALSNISLDVDTARRLAEGDHPPTVDEIQRAAWLSEVSGTRDLIAAAVRESAIRQPLDADHPIDWDETPTIYQAITIARGHLLEFREVWRADGYSLGDLLHSLPLAPGQRRQVAILDWERRTTNVREESLEYEEELEAMVGRDRDITEIVGSRLAEESEGSSRNTTWGAAGGVGGGFIAGAWGVFGGVAGSASGSISTSSLESSRQFSADTLQSLRDRVVQRSSAVRDERSTTVESVAQGETLRAETETIANYNHCHAMTIEYFEVLRHFIITHELADVREVLFVPMAMTQFNQAKALRWQTPLSTYLKDKALLPGFDAMRRVADNWEGWDYPVARYCEEAPQVLEGELRISFVLPRPRDAEDGKYQVDRWKPYEPSLRMASQELWTKLVSATAEYNAAEIARRDSEFRRLIAPDLARHIMDRLTFAYVTTDGAEREVSLDATLVSSYAEGVPLYVTLRASGGVPPTPREKIAQFAIRLAGAELPPDAQLIVHSGRMRYRTEHKSWLLFDDPRIQNDLSNTDAVFIPTPTSWEETRNPRQEDQELAVRLVAHLNASLEFYHQAIWMWLDPERRFMLLDGILVPGLGGRSVASVVENRLIGIAGNSMIFPLAPGLRLDPRVSGKSKGDLIDLYGVDSAPPVRVSVPTRGVYAEAVLGECNACEEIDDSRYWRWTTAGMLTPPSIEPVSTATRATPEKALTPTPLPTPLVSIQNAPALPNPVGLGEIFQLLAKSDTFTDIAGLEGTQKNARAAFDAAMSSAAGIGSQAAQIASQNITAASGERMLDRIMSAQGDKLLSPEMAQQLSEKVFNSMLGQPNGNAQTKADSPLSDPAVTKALDSLAQSDSGSAKVSTNDESIEMKFDGGGVAVGAAAAGLLDIDDNFVQVDVTLETGVGDVGARTWQTVRISDMRKLPALPNLPGGLPKTMLRERPGQNVSPLSSQPVAFDILSRLRIQFPSDPGKPKELARGTSKLPIVFLVHGHSAVNFLGSKDSYQGFADLQDNLARAGIVSVSVDMNVANAFDAVIEMRAETLIAAIEKMIALDKDPASTFHGRLNFSRVGFMGHSRGGDAVVRAALINLNKKLCSIMIIVLVAPTDLTGTFRPPSFRGEYGARMDLDSYTALVVIQGGLDGDVSGFKGVPRDVMGTGYGHYDRWIAAKAHVFIPLATHNRFNSKWPDEKWLLPGDAQRAIGQAEHAALLNFYGATALRIRNTGKPLDAYDILSGRKMNPLGIETSLLWDWSSGGKILDDFEGPTAKIGTRTLHDATIERFEDVVFGTEKLWAHVPHQTRVLTIGANLTGVSPFAYELAFAPNENWWGRHNLDINVATSVDTTSANTVAAAVSPPFLTVTLCDAKNKVKSIDLRKFASAGSTSRPLFHEVLKDPDSNSTATKNCTLIRLETYSIPLTEFTGVDLRIIRRLQILPPASLPQLIFIDSIRVAKKS